MPKAKQRDGVYQRPDRPGWWVSYIDASGERVRRKVEAHTRTQALAALAGIKGKVEKEEILGIRPASAITTHDLLQRFRRYQKTKLRGTSFARLDGVLKTLETHLPAEARNITRRTVDEFIEKRSETVQAGTIKKEVFALHKALRLGVKWGLLNQNAAEDAELPKEPEGRTRYLTPGEFRAALEIAPEWMRAPLAFAVATGVRRGELLNLRWMDADSSHKRLYVRETKNGEMRVLPVSNSALEILASLPQGTASEPVFNGIDPQQLSVYTIRVFKRLGIKDASFHTLRHTFASWMVMQGVPLYTVGQLLGHKTPRMTQRYAHLAPDYMAGAVETMDGIMDAALSKNGQDGLRLVTVESPEKEAEEPARRKLLK
ncbi:MAG TPA: site-specific integrase [Terracidiphilus sp.]|nr:site-specific integrase [Terracidiphilus sp.]